MKFKVVRRLCFCCGLGLNSMLGSEGVSIVLAVHAVSSATR